MSLRKVPLITRLLLIAVVTNSTAVAGTVWLSHSLAEANVISNDTLIPIGVIVILLGLAIRATWALGRFCDRITKFEKRLEAVEQRVNDMEPGNK